MENYSKIQCSNCARDFHASLEVLTEDGSLCPSCFTDYVEPQYRKCGLCGETDKDITVFLSAFQVKGFDTPERVCATCILYDSEQNLHQLIKKLQ